MFQNINPLAKSTAFWEIALMLIGAFILGYLLCKWRCWSKCCDDCNCDDKKFTIKNTKNTTNTNVESKNDNKNNFAWAGNLSAKDDLKKVEGIGPAIEKVLNAAGIMTFSDLANTTQEEIKKLLNAAGPHFQIHDGETWAEQASLLRDGKMAEFEALVEKLKGGKRV